MDGAHASTVFTDRSGKTWTPDGNAQISVAQSVFGGASYRGDGSGDSIHTPPHADFNFGTGDFTACIRVRFDSLGGGLVRALMSCYAGSGSGWGVQLDAADKLIVSLTGDGVDAQGVTALTALTWYDIVVARRGNKLRIFINGALELEVTDTQNITGSATMYIGAVYVGGIIRSIAGHIDEVLIVKGVALWDRAHTTPATAFADT
jgi:hypothetical protein